MAHNGVAEALFRRNAISWIEKCDTREMNSKKSMPDFSDCTKTVSRPFGCMELWAGNEKAHRSIELAGLEADVIAVPSGSDSGGDLSAVFSCTDDVISADLISAGSQSG